MSKLKERENDREREGFRGEGDRESPTCGGVGTGRLEVPSIPVSLPRSLRVSGTTPGPGETVPVQDQKREDPGKRKGPTYLRQTTRALLPSFVFVLHPSRESLEGLPYPYTFSSPKDSVLIIRRGHPNSQVSRD